MLCFDAMTDPKSTETYLAIAQRLRTFRPEIVIDDHLKDGIVQVESSVLGGIFFEAANFPRLLELFKTVVNDRGERAFDYYSLKKDKLRHFLKSMVTLNFLDISYLATHGHGFREIWSGPQLDSRPLSRSDLGQGRFAPLWDKRFGGQFGAAGTGDKRMDLTSVHVALSDEICNIHIDDVGFVLRGLDGQGAMDPDAIQHLTNELLWKTYLAPHISKWLGDHLTLDLPSSRTGYRPMIGLTLDLPEEGMSISATLTLKCKCLPGGHGEVDHIPEGSSVAVSFTKQMDWFGGSTPVPRPRRR
jgi:hypothetical protein